MDEEQKNRVVYRSSSIANAYGGVAYAYAHYDSSVTFTSIGSRLAFDEMDEEQKNRVVYRSSSIANAYGGVAYAYAHYDSSVTFTSIGSRLAFKTRELAEYAGKQFIEIWADYVFKPNGRK